jgi:glycosyltransferase involved in cell wall biosynthesis
MSNAVPQISIILPCRDAAAYLPACIASLARQTHGDYEVITIDDGSKDYTPDILQRWQADDPRVRVIRQAPLGLVAALNRGVAEARAPVLARMDADDLCHRRRLEMQLNLLRTNEGDVVSCLVRCFPRAHIRLGMRRYERWLNSLTTHVEIERDLFVESPLAHPSVMLRTEALRALGGYRDCGWPEDYDLWMRAYDAGLRFAKVNRYLYWWRERADRLSRTDSAYSPAAFRRCKAHYLKAMYLHPGDSVVIWGAGKEGKALARHLRRAEIDVAAFIDVDPRKIGNTVLGAPVLGVDGLTRAHYLLVAVGAPGAREEIRAYLAGVGWGEPRDYRSLA